MANPGAGSDVTSRSAGPAATLAADAVVSDTYRVLRCLGRGGMGEVYEVQHLRTKARLALKLLVGVAALDPELVSRFRREAETTSALNHPNIVRVFDFNSLPDGRPYLVMELLEGAELSSIVRPTGGLPLQTVMPIVEQIARGLTAAHTRGIVHRDLKPSNVFLVPLGADQSLVKILDFGISKVLTSSVKLTQREVVLGSPNYMSPEQAKGNNDEVDARTDQFALGAIAYELLTGRMAFIGDSIYGVLYAVINQEVAPFSSLGVSVPVGAEAVVRKALSKRREDRWADVEQFVRALSEYARSGGEPNRSEPVVRATILHTGDGAVGGMPSTTLRAATGERDAVPLAPERPGRTKIAIAGALGAAALLGGVVSLLGRAGEPSPSAAVVPASTVDLAPSSGRETPAPPPRERSASSPPRATEAPKGRNRQAGAEPGELPSDSPEVAPARAHSRRRRTTTSSPVAPVVTAPRNAIPAPRPGAELRNEEL